MYTRYYDSYPSAIDEKTESENIPQSPPQENPSLENTHVSEIASSQKKLFGSHDFEDLLLIALLFITVTESKDDFILPLILGAILLE